MYVTMRLAGLGLELFSLVHFLVLLWRFCIGAIVWLLVGIDTLEYPGHNFTAFQKKYLVRTYLLLIENLISLFDHPLLEVFKLCT
jgi:hypothetical protein